MRRALLALLALLALPAGASVPVPESARGAGALDGREARVEGRLLLQEGASPGRWRVGVLLTPDPGWHLYWRNPGESGLAPRLAWGLAGAPEAQLEVGEVEWPAPQRYLESEGELTTYGYGSEVLLAADAVVRGTVPDGAEVVVDVDVLVCESQCIPGSFRLRRPLRRSDSPAAVAATADAFARWARTIPVAASDLGVEVTAHHSRSAVRPGDAFATALVVRPCGAREPGAPACALGPPRPGTPAFFAYESDWLAVRATAVRPHPREEDAFVVDLVGESLPEDPGEESRLRGSLVLTDPSGTAHHAEVDVALPRAPAGARVETRDLASLLADGPRSVAVSALVRALLLGVIGGLLLNLMPCVLPVLAIKICALAELGHRNRREVVAHAIAYSAGVVLTMACLAVAVVALRAAGTAVGWGFQLQEPAFVAGVAALLVAFASNLFGVFEIQPDTSGLAGIGAQASGARRSFFDGLLAVVLATPCSAPFLGTAVGFAFAGSGYVVFAIFVAIGLGLAAPFALVAVVPSWARFVPRSGPWMLDLRRGLGFALLLTAIWLLWIVGRSSGVGGMSSLLVLLFCVAFASWIFGVVQRRRPGVPLAALAVALVLIVAAGLRAAPPVAPPADADPSTASGGPRPYAEEAVAEALSGGRPAFVYFTADWCITCKVNEKRVLTDERVVEALDRMGFAVFRADWTRRDESIRRALARLGKAGVPVYALFSPAAPDRPTLLPELLTVDRLLGALEATASAFETAATAPLGRTAAR